MNILVAPNAFKESLTAHDAAEAIAKGLRNNPRVTVECVPIADGGDGTMEVLKDARDVEITSHNVSGPHGDEVQGEIGWYGKPLTAVIEMASASGLRLLPPERREPILASTYGTGELIDLAIAKGARRILIGVGGSATVDGGVGMAQALGCVLYNDKGDEIPRYCGNLHNIKKIDNRKLKKRIAGIEIDVACDVTNPLLGPNGAAHVFGPQKGASPQEIQILEKKLSLLAAAWFRDLGVDVKDMPGAGAAGGLAAGLAAFCGAYLCNGFELISDEIGLEEKIRRSDMVITGEGKFDSQSLQGKGPGGVIALAKKHGRKTIIVAGVISLKEKELAEFNILKYFELISRAENREESMKNAAELMEMIGVNIALNLH